ncbi:MAG TPA: hypothetical protein VN634_21675 [Candidatus Limnocylindrales bacterium]|nr:hypothetical protein [Candidatus Limnocylindrales bacterium]
MALCGVGCPLMLVLPWYTPYAVNWPVAMFSFLFFAVFLFVSVSAVRRSGDVIVVDDDGIRCDSPVRPPVSIRWDEIGDVHAENVMQRLVVCDVTGLRRITAEFHLQDFGVLRRTVFERAARSDRGSPRI